MMKNYNLLWILPFIVSCIVYAGLNFFMARPTITTPSLIGKSLLESLSILGQNGLNARDCAVTQEEREFLEYEKEYIADLRANLE